MKATLIRKAEGWYNLYQDKIGIGSTHSELQGYKLSKQNCDEIFGVIDVEKLADTICIRTTESFAIREVWKDGFNKAMELNKDKQFTSRDMLSAYMEGTNDGTQFESLMDYDSEDFDDAHEFAKQAEREFIQSLQQPTEIEVEIEMRTASLVYKTDEVLPKLDANGCLILKKI
jgi:hypothetical protein